VRIIEVIKKPLFGGYTIKSEHLFRTKLKGTTSIKLMEMQLAIDEKQLTAFGA